MGRNVKKLVCVWAAAAALNAGVLLTCAAQRPGAAAPPAGNPQVPQPTGAGPQTVAPANPFSPPNLKNFNADAPTKNDVDAFLKALWGYDPNRIWQVQAILKTPAPGISKVVVQVADKSQPGKTASTVFFTTPDGQHAIADNVIDFGPKPFAANRAVLQAQADGPARGATGKDLLLVEFADLQCPHCRDAQSTMDSLVQDFPQARVVFENLPLTAIHPFAMQAAEEGECVRRSKGDAAFFAFAQAVYNKQDGLTPEQAATTFATAATQAGADPAAVAKCAATPAVREAIESQVKLANSLGVEQTPTLAINGHLMPLTSLPYEVLKRIVAFQAGQDGVTVRLQPTLTTLK